MGNAKILVTGATGFTGGHLARRLAGDGHAVRALVRRPEKGKELADLGIELVPGDLTDPESLHRAMEGIELVYHIAATFREESISEEQMWAVNCDGVRNMLEAAVTAGTVQRFVHCSTIGVHGDVKNPPATEESPYAPGDYYQESKTAGEKIAIEYMKAGKLPIAIFRPGGIYGPGDTRFLKLFRPIKKQRFLMIGSGKVLYTLIHIDDLVDGIILCGTHQNAVGNIYILTGEPALTLNQFMATIADVVGVPKPKLRVPVMPIYWAGYLCELACKPLGIEPPLYRRRVDFFRKDRSFSVAKARQELGFSPKVDLRTGLAQTARWYEEQGLM
ncbi:MAG: NAD-dependent epimerase/dehydratase family protein [Anaerolineaceae bacterium]|nr:NAD-dependent epimerase/dehydratase family protein [Anaerolineaceae bacterium]